MDTNKHPVTPLPMAGVTLIELLVVVAVLGILAAIAMPTYNEYVRSANRADAKGILLETAQFMERNYTTNGCYHRTDGDCGNATVILALPILQSPKTGTARYNIAATYSTTAPCTMGQCYTLTATPTGGYLDATCGTLSLTESGVQTSTSGTLAECWQR